MFLRNERNTTGTHSSDFQGWFGRRVVKIVINNSIFSNVFPTPIDGGIILKLSQYSTPI